MRINTNDAQATWSQEIPTVQGAKFEKIIEQTPLDCNGSETLLLKAIPSDPEFGSH